jgi:hypothetical protein
VRFISLQSQVCIPANTSVRDGDGGDGHDIASVKDYGRRQNSVNNFQRQHKRIFRCIPSYFRIQHSAQPILEGWNFGTKNASSVLARENVTIPTSPV